MTHFTNLYHFLVILNSASALTVKRQINFPHFAITTLILVWHNIHFHRFWIIGIKIDHEDRNSQQQLIMATSPNDIEGVKPRGGGDDESACGSFVAGLIWFISILLIICTFPFSLCVCVRMVQVSKNITVNNFIKSLRRTSLKN